MSKRKQSTLQIVRGRAQRRRQQARMAGMQRAKPPKSAVNLGPMGDLGPDVLIRIELLRRPRVIDLTLNELRDFTERTIYRPIRKKIVGPGGLIGAIVPKATGRLRESLINTFEKSRFSISEWNTRNNMELQIGTDVEYSAVVNRMPSSWLRHPHPWSSNTGPGNVPLRDPKSLTNFYQNLVSQGRLAARRAWRNKFMPTMMRLFHGVAGRRNAQREFNRTFKMTIPLGYTNV